MNWLAYNVAHDVALPGSKRPGARIPDVPAGRNRRGTRLDSLDPDTFKYVITSKELAPA